MKVGILTMSRVINYGSFLQAYALKRIVESLGHECSFRDFKKGELRHRGNKVKKDDIFKKLKNLQVFSLNPRSYFNKREFKLYLRQIFEDTCWPMLGLSREYNFDLNCDVMLIGSDEVFNYTQNHAFGYVPCLFGYEINAQRIVSYAACAGYASITDIENDKMGDEISNGFNKMYKISVRDQNTYDIVNKYSTKTPSMVLDPTLIYDFDWSLTERVKVSKYILIYAYEGRLDEENEISLIRQFASQKGLITVSIGSYHHWCDENLVPTPFELLAYFAQSSYVITDTFHGTIFSIKCKKQFISLARKNNKYGSNENKVQYLLRQCGLYDRLLYSIDSFETEIIKPINYDETSQKIEILRASSLQFIKEALTVN